MSVITPADRALDLARFELELARVHLQRSLDALRHALDGNTWGASDFSPEFAHKAALVRDGLIHTIVKADLRINRLGPRKFTGIPEGYQPLDEEGSR